jgi:hypothetical protein
MAVNYRVMNCEPRHVFDVLAKGWVYPSWVVGASRMRDVDEGWPRPGTNIHHSFCAWPMLLDDTTSMLEWDPPRHALIKALGWPIGEAHVAIDVRERGGISNVRMVEDVISGPARFIPGPARDAATHARNAETLRRLAYLAEGYAKNER